MVEQHYVRNAFLLLNEVYLNAEEDLGEEHGLFIGLMHTYYLSLWLNHFYGTEKYRNYLRTAVDGLLYLLPRAQDADQKREIEYNLCVVLTHQLDWSLDDLELDSTERQIVDRVLADLPAPDFEIEF